ncbi:probable G protein-coupled receptor 85 [Lingula anatina]|uniref:Probable G protein-coupled receptor 85 n=1 Tax=Lingula anatina TaxID=7574 RepID=A0A1S3JBG4_LINAN|nr:probable G protein-coupled receptor 85 [Lingula anatina]XP_013407743.1 probable G protein-coupled receptor 85 [Lingula anatina]|eukprot:XP_013407742.1 probable G protein-coupled receptor 85 [Lingula anatina]
MLIIRPNLNIKGKLIEDLARLENMSAPYRYGEGGTPELMEYYSVLHILKCVTLGIIIVTAVAGNFLVVFVISKDRRLHRPPYYCMLSLAMADLIRSAVCLPFVLATVMQRTYWLRGQSGCRILAGFNALCVFSALFSIFTMALDRHFGNIHYDFYRKIQGTTSLAIALSGWILALFMALLPALGLGSYRYYPLESQCTYEHGYYISNNTLGYALIFIVVVIITVCVYVGIFTYLRRRRRMRPVETGAGAPARSTTWNFIHPGAQLMHRQLLAVTQPTVAVGAATAIQAQLSQPAPSQPTAGNQGSGGSATTPASSTRSSSSKQTDQITRAFLCVTVFFVILWMPYLVLFFWYMIDANQTPPLTFITIATWCSYFQVAIATPFYVVFISKFRRGISYSICCCCRRQGYDVPSSTVTAT